MATAVAAAMTAAMTTAMAAAMAAAVATAVATVVGRNQGHVCDGRVGAMRALNQAGVESLRGNPGGC